MINQNFIINQNLFQAPTLKQPPPMAMVSPTLSSSTSSQKKGDLSPGTPCSQCLRESNGHAGNGSTNKLLTNSMSPSGKYENIQFFREIVVGRKTF